MPWRSGSGYKKGVQPFIPLLQGFSTTWGTHKEEELEFKPAPRHSAHPESPTSACKQKPCSLALLVLAGGLSTRLEK